MALMCSYMKFLSVPKQPRCRLLDACWLRNNTCQCGWQRRQYRQGVPSRWQIHSPVHLTGRLQFLYQPLCSHMVAYIGLCLCWTLWHLMLYRSAFHLGSQWSQSSQRGNGRVPAYLLDHGEIQANCLGPWSGLPSVSVHLSLVSLWLTLWCCWWFRCPRPHQLFWMYPAASWCVEQTLHLHSHRT